VKARILLASTSEVYGNPTIHPQQETYWGNVNPIGLRSCYDEGKRVAETLMMDYHRQNAVDIKMVRIFNTYGPRMAINDGRVISNFIVQALRREDLTVFGDGTQTRSFCYVSDLIEGIVRMVETNDFIGPVNLGNPIELSILEIANKILSMMKSQSKIVSKPLPPDDPDRRCPDISIAKKVLNWTPRVSLDEGLGKTIKYFKEKLGIRR
jgi:UDP-glucuronate decarboxylase